MKFRNFYEKLDKKSISLVVILIIVGIFMHFINPNRFLTIDNFKSMAIQMSETGILSLAFYIVIAIGGFNLSVIAVANLSAAFMALIASGRILSNIFTTDSIKLLVGIIIALIVGILSGLLNGFFVRKLKLNSVLVTAASLQFFAGITFVITKGKSIVGAPYSFVNFSANSIFKTIPNLFILMLFCFLIVSAFFNYMKYGEQAKLFGFNEIASEYSGIANNKVTYIAFALSGLFSAIGGIVIYSRMGIIKPDYGMDSLGGNMFLVVLLGGAMMTGGGGKIINIFLSLFVLQIISSGLSLGNYTPFNKQFVWGILLLIVIIISSPAMQEYIENLSLKNIYKKLKINNFQ